MISTIQGFNQQHPSFKGFARFDNGFKQQETTPTQDDAVLGVLNDIADTKMLFSMQDIIELKAQNKHGDTLLKAKVSDETIGCINEIYHICSSDDFENCNDSEPDTKIGDNFVAVVSDDEIYFSCGTDKYEKLSWSLNFDDEISNETLTIDQKDQILDRFKNLFNNLIKTQEAEEFIKKENAKQGAIKTLLQNLSILN